VFVFGVLNVYMAMVYRRERGMNKGLTASLFLGVALVAFGIFIFITRVDARNEEIVIPNIVNTPRTEELNSVALPRDLEIPSLKVNVAITEGGITSAGKMEAPKDDYGTTWYKYGYRPGEKGNAVIAGHYDDRWGRPSTFGHLKDLKIGDSVFVTTADGAKLEFRVTKIAEYDYYEKKLSEVFGPSETAHLNLITCHGSWLPTKKVYEKRLIVFTELVARP
jgi:LPXTG-site transpeptidase (sortase) family protein